jgi:hypothetical protein
MSFRTSRLFFSVLCFQVVLGCSQAGLLDHPQTIGVETTHCPLEVSTVGKSFKSAGLVKYVFTPRDLKDIYVLEPLSESFEAIRHDQDERTNEEKKRFGVLKEDQKRREFRSQPISLVWGVPSAAWYSVGDFSQKGVFKVLPGEYRIRIRYSLDGRKKFRYLCFAETDTFEVREGSLWVSTGE